MQMPLQSLLASSTVRASLGTGAVAAVQSATSGGISVPAWAYALLAVVLGLLGVYLARLVTIDAENKKLGRVQTLRETGPLTWIGVLIVCPLIWHFDIAVPWASMIGLGVGYSVRIVLKIFGSGAAGAARALVQQAARQLEKDDAEAAAAASPPAPVLDAPGARHVAVILPPDPVQPIEELVERLKSVPPTPPLPPRLKNG